VSVIGQPTQVRHSVNGVTKLIAHWIWWNRVRGPRAIGWLLGILRDTCNSCCAVATGEKVEVLDVDVRGADGAQPVEGQGNPPPCEGEGGIDGFATLKALGLDWDLIQTLTLCARTTKRWRSCLVEARQR
jgi:hypothetical protein